MKSSPLNTAKAVKTYQINRKARLLADPDAYKGLKSKGRRGSRLAPLDAQASAECIARGECEAKGLDIECFGVLEPHHIKRRRHQKVRFSQENLLCLCTGHHLYLHGNRKVELAFIENRWPGRLERLTSAANGVEI